MIRRSSGHAAAGWFLQESVHKHPGARDGPQKLYRRPVEYYRHVLGGDPAYNGVTFRNTIVAGPHPDDWIVEHPATGGYNLAGGCIGPYWRVPSVPTTPEGRHITLFRLADEARRAGVRHRRRRARPSPRVERGPAHSPSRPGGLPSRTRVVR